MKYDVEISSEKWDLTEMYRRSEKQFGRVTRLYLVAFKVPLKKFNKPQCSVLVFMPFV